MNTQENELQLLVNFFRCYFHQDWMCDAASPAEVVTSYLQTAMPHEVAALRDAILHYAECMGGDTKLDEASLFSELGCNYLPSADGLTAREWLLNIAALLHAAHEHE